MDKLSKSIRKYIRKQKARLRQEVFDRKEQKLQIAALYLRFGIDHSPKNLPKKFDKKFAKK